MTELLESASGMTVMYLQTKTQRGALKVLPDQTWSPVALSLVPLNSNDHKPAQSRSGNLNARLCSMLLLSVVRT
jgi:hypothetical protein